MGVTYEVAKKKFEESQAKEKQHQKDNPTSAGSPVGETSAQKADRISSGISSGGQSEASKQLTLHGITYDNITQERFNSLSGEAQGEILRQQQEYINNLQKQNERLEANELGTKNYSNLTLGEAQYAPTAKASVTTEKYDSRSPELKNILGNLDSYYKQKQKFDIGDIPSYASEGYRIEGEDEDPFFRTKRGDLSKKKGKTSVTEIYKMKDYADKAVRLDFGESELIGTESSSTSKYSPMDDLGTWTITPTQGKAKISMENYKEYKTNLSKFSKDVRETKPDKVTLSYIEGGKQKTVPIDPTRVAYDVQKQRVELGKRGIREFGLSTEKFAEKSTTTKYPDGDIVTVKDLPVNWSGVSQPKSKEIKSVIQGKDGTVTTVYKDGTKTTKLKSEQDLGMIGFQYGTKTDSSKVKDLSKNRDFKEDDPRYYAEYATRPLDNLFKMGANLIDERTGESKKAGYVPYELKQTIEDKVFALGDEPLANLGLDKELLVTGEKRNVTPFSTAVSDITKIKPVELLQLPAIGVTWLAGGYAAKPVTKGIQLVGTQALKKTALASVKTWQQGGLLGGAEVVGVKTLSGRTVQVMLGTTELRGKTVTASIDILKQQKAVDKIKALEIKKAKTNTELKKLYTPSSTKITTPAKNTAIANKQAKLTDRLEKLDIMINKAKNKLPEESLYEATFKTPKGTIKYPKQVIPKEVGSEIPLESIIFTKGKKGVEVIVMGGKRTNLTPYESMTELTGAVVQGREPSKLLAGVKLKKNVYGIPEFGGKPKAVVDKFKEVQLGKRVWEVQGMGTKTAESLGKLEDVKWIKGVGDIYKFKLTDIMEKPQEFGKFLRDPNVLGKETIGFERIGKDTPEYGKLAEKILTPDDMYGVQLKPTYPTRPLGKLVARITGREDKGGLTDLKIVPQNLASSKTTDAFVFNRPEKGWRENTAYLTPFLGKRTVKRGSSWGDSGKIYSDYEKVDVDVISKVLAHESTHPVLTKIAGLKATKAFDNIEYGRGSEFVRGNFYYPTNIAPAILKTGRAPSDIIKTRLGKYPKYIKGEDITPDLPKTAKIIKDPTKLYAEVARYYESKVEPFLQEPVEIGRLPSNYPKTATTTLGRLKERIKPPKYPKDDPFLGTEPRVSTLKDITKSKDDDILRQILSLEPTPSKGSQLLKQMDIEKVSYPDLGKLYSTTGLKKQRPLATGAFAVLTGTEIGKKTSGTRTIQEAKPSQGLIKTIKFQEEKRTYDAFGDIYTKTEKAMLQEERQRGKQDYYSEQLVYPRQSTEQKGGFAIKNVFGNIMATPTKQIEGLGEIGKINKRDELKLQMIFPPITTGKRKDTPALLLTPLITTDLDEGLKIDQPQKITTDIKQGWKFEQTFGVPYEQPFEKVPDIPPVPDIFPDPKIGKGGLFPFGDMSYVGNDERSFGRFFRVYDVAKEPFGEVKVGLGYFEDRPYAFSEVRGMIEADPKLFRTAGRNKVIDASGMDVSFTSTKPKKSKRKR